MRPARYSHVPSVVCAGHLNWDVTLRVDRLPDPDDEASIRSERGERGGSAANAACALVDLGVDASVLASVGDDERGARATTALDGAGVDAGAVVTVPGGTTAVKYLVVAPDGEVLMFGRDGDNEAFDADDLPAGALRSADHLHLTGQDPRTAAALADRAHEAGVPVSFDPGRRVGDRSHEATLDRADLLFLTDREAALALGADAPAGRTLVLKHGRRGAEAFAPEGRFAHPGYEVDVVDTSGAGDAFAAGYLSARLRGADPDRCLAVANACGALAAAATGRRPDLDRASVEALVAGGGDPVEG
jgi:ribokinase